MPTLHRLILGPLFLSALASAEPSQSTLATRLETQAEVAVGHTNFTAPPLPSRFAILVADAAQNSNADSAQLFETPKNLANAPTMEFGGDTAGALTMLKTMASATSPLAPLTGFEGAPQVAELATQAQQNIQLLALAMEKSGGNSNFFLTVSAKGAIQAWNKLVNSVMDKMESLYADPVPDVKQWESMRNFLMDPKTLEMRGVLAGFSEKKAAQ